MNAHSPNALRVLCMAAAGILFAAVAPANAAAMHATQPSPMAPLTVAQLEWGGTVIIHIDPNKKDNKKTDNKKADNKRTDVKPARCADDEIAADIKAITDDGKAKLLSTTGMKAQTRVSLAVLVAVRDYYAAAANRCNRPNFNDVVNQINGQIAVLRARIKAL